MKLAKPVRLLLMTATLATVASVGQRSVMNQKPTAPLLGKDGPFGEASTSSLQDEKAVDLIRPIPVKTSGVVGRLSIYAMRDPSFNAFSEGLSADDRYLDVALTGDEWHALFSDVLGCPDVSDVPRLPNEDREEWGERYSLKFRQAMPQHPLIGRVWDLFIYVSYKPEEIQHLRKECLRIQAGTSNEKALAGLAKLVSACDEASKLGSGLLFVPD